MVIQIIEIVLILGLLVISWRIVRRSFAANLLRFAQRLTCIAIGVVGGVAAFRPLEAVTSNFVLQFILAYAFGTALFVLTAVCLGRLSRRGDWAQRFENTLRLPRWVDRALIVVTLLVFWLFVLIGADITGQLISMHPRRAAADQSLVMRYFVQPEQRPSTPGDAAQYSPEQLRVLEKMAAQADFFGRFRRGIRQTSDTLLDVTGTETVLTKLEVVQQILNLPQDEKRWLVRQNPQLMQLSNHPAILRITKNEILLTDLERVSQGSLKSVYRIGDDPDVRQLLEDPDVRGVISDVDPAQLLEQLETYRQARESDTAESINSGSP